MATGTVTVALTTKEIHQAICAAPAPKIPDGMLDTLGTTYRKLCGHKEKLSMDGLVITFEDFVHIAIKVRADRGMPIC